MTGAVRTVTRSASVQAENQGGQGGQGGHPAPGSLGAALASGCQGRRVPHVQGHRGHYPLAAHRAALFHADLEHWLESQCST